MAAWMVALTPSTAHRRLAGDLRQVFAANGARTARSIAWARYVCPGPAGQETGVPPIRIHLDLRSESGVVGSDRRATSSGAYFTQSCHLFHRKVAIYFRQSCHPPEQSDAVCPVFPLVPVLAMGDQIGQFQALCLHLTMLAVQFSCRRRRVPDTCLANGDEHSAAVVGTISEFGVLAAISRERLIAPAEAIVESLVHGKVRPDHGEEKPVVARCQVD